MSTEAASLARKRAVIAYRLEDEIGRFESIKECSESLGIPSSKICDSARYGITFRKVYNFKYDDKKQQL